MGKSRTTRKSKGGGRGSPEAIAKRRAARTLNSLFGERRSVGARIDGRTEKRRRRLLAELRDGRGGQPLKAIEVLTHTNELLAMGETLSSIRKAGAKPLEVELDDSDMEIVRQTQQEYQFRPEAWTMLGVEIAEDGTPVRKSRKKAS